MKKLTKILAIALAVVMLFALSAVALAADNGTITVKNATKGYKYEAYKILDATYQGDAVSYTTSTPDVFNAEGSPWVVGTIADKEGNYSVTLAEGKTVADVNTWITNNLTSFTAIPANVGVDDDGLATEKEVKWTGLDYGYYYITSGLGSVVTIDSATPSATVYDKNETVPTDPVKEIVTVDGTAVSSETPLKETDAHVGSVVGFKITAKTNNWIDKDTIRTEWTITDTPTNMTVDTDSIVVKFNGTELNKGTDYTLSGSFTITVPMVDDDGNSVFAANLGDTAGLIPIEITYSATITADAGDSPAKNEIPNDVITVYTYMFELDKVDENRAALTGAKFEVYDKDGTKLTFTVNDAGKYVYDAAGTVTEIDLTETASAVITGLDIDWAPLTVKETVVPDGYNQAPDTTVAAEDLTKVEENATPNKVEIKNEKGQLLPETGGIGTRIFYIVGAILVLGAGVVLVTKRKMDVQ